MTATRSRAWVQGAVPMKTVKTETSYEVRRCRARAVAARAQCPRGRSRQRGSAWTYVYNVLPRGVRARRETPPVSGMPRYRAPGSLTGDCPNARERAVRQRIT
jgi:hypothetical protein